MKYIFEQAAKSTAKLRTPGGSMRGIAEISVEVMISFA
jgi:hypothetical protein